MSDKIWVVEEQQWESYVDGLGEDYAIVSIHRTKEGAEKFAEARWKDNAVSILTGGEIEDLEAGPDKIIGAIEAIEEPEMAEELRKEAAKPGAVWEDVLLKFCKKYHEDDIADLQVKSKTIKE